MTSQKCNKWTYGDFICMDINHLKDYLTVRGISISSYTKIELVARAFSAGSNVAWRAQEKTERLQFTRCLQDFK